MSDTPKDGNTKRPTPPQDPERPVTPQPKDAPDAPRRMRWPADFPAKH